MARPLTEAELDELCVMQEMRDSVKFISLIARAREVLHG